MLRLFMIILLLFTFSSSIANPSPKINHVIYVTLDGVRWQDVYLDHSYLKTFWEKHANKMNNYGMPNTASTMAVASVPTSLPSYQSQMSGSIQPCVTNQCGRITVKTLPENLMEKLSLRKQDVAVFSSWYEISYSVEHIFGSVYTNTGNFPVYDPNTQTADDVMYDLNLRQTYDAPGDHERYDKYTFAQAIHYFETYKPRFLWISLNDADEAAHASNLNRYHDAIKFYDYALDEVFSKLKAMHIENETMVIVTTDHGRGNGALWTSHGPGIPGCKQTWAFVMNGNLKPVSQSGGTFNYNTLSVRPTVEAAFDILG